MEVHEVDFNQYCSLKLEPTNVFGTDAFLRLNSGRADCLKCYVNADGDLGIVFGQKEGVLCAPWSAPYMALSSSKKIDRADLREFGSCVRNEVGVETSFRLITPPACYGADEDAFAQGFRRENDREVKDTSLVLQLSDAIGENDWSKNARRNLKRASGYGLRLVKTEEIADCYKIIEEHHRRLGYRMAMTLNQIEDTAKILPVDFWVVRQDEKAVAAAYFYRVRPEVVQLINIGYSPEGKELRAATFLMRHIIDYYRDNIIETVGSANALLDYGPTSVDGVQNEGLLRFKRGLGFEVSWKTTLSGS